MTQVISSVEPKWVVPGGRVTVTGAHLPVPADGLPHVLIGSHDARVIGASRTRLRVAVPASVEGGTMALRIDELPGATAYLDVAHQIATGLHQVDSPAFDGLGRLY